MTAAETCATTARTRLTLDRKTLTGTASATPVPRDGPTHRQGFWTGGLKPAWCARASIGSDGRPGALNAERAGIASPPALDDFYHPDASGDRFAGAALVDLEAELGAGRGNSSEILAAALALSVVGERQTVGHVGRRGGRPAARGAGRVETAADQEQRLFSLGATDRLLG